MAAGELKGFTGVDAPYEAPEKPDIDLPNWDMSIDECVATLIASLKKEGVLSGGPYDASGLPVPPGFDGEWLEDKLQVKPSALAKARAEAETLPKILMTDIDVNWLQVRRLVLRRRAAPRESGARARRVSARRPARRRTRARAHRAVRCHRSSARGGPRRSRASCARARCSRRSTSTRC